MMGMIDMTARMIRAMMQARRMPTGLHSLFHTALKSARLASSAHCSGCREQNEGA